MHCFNAGGFGELCLSEYPEKPHRCRVINSVTKMSDLSKQNAPDSRFLEDSEDDWLSTSTIFGFNGGDDRSLEESGLGWQGDSQADNRLRLAASVFDNTRDSIMVTDPQGRIVDVNRAFVRSTGYQPAEVLGQLPSMLKSDQHPREFFEALWLSLRTVGYWRGEIWNRRKSGEVFVELLSISAVRNQAKVLTHYVAIYTDITALKESQQRLEYLAYHDALTRLPNRVLLVDRIRQALAAAKRHNSMTAVCFADLDHFKPINDTHGHEVGDLLLIELAGRLKAAVREGDTVARIGGDEFALLLNDLQAPSEIDVVLKRVLESVSQPYHLGPAQATVSISVGYTVAPFDGADPDTLLRHADQAMYQAKLEGRNRSHRFDIESDKAVRHHQETLSRLRQAMHANELCLFYQPKVDMRNGNVVGVEALMRWRHPERGLLLPGAFLMPIGNHALLADLGDWAIREALRQMRVWKRAGLKVSVGVNISPVHLLHPEFVERLRRYLAEYADVDPRYLEFEILESAALEDVPHVSRLIGQCRELGVEFALDDFGTGYSSLLYLKRLPAKTLKIDRSFVTDLLDTVEGAEAMAGIVTLASAFNRRTVAEGVEHIEQGVALLRLRCDIAQGFAIARPMEADALLGWIKAFLPDPAWRSSIEMPWRKSDFPLLAAEIEQRRWLAQIIKAVEQGTELPAMPANHLMESRFGRWLNGVGGARYKNYSQLHNLSAAYVKTARVGAEISVWLNRGDRGRAKMLLPGLSAEHQRFAEAWLALRKLAAQQK